MATLLGRPIAFPDIGFGDQDQDGNTALLELDRGIIFYSYCHKNMSGNFTSHAHITLFRHLHYTLRA